MLICPKCGKKSNETQFVEAFCVDCYPFRLEIPRNISIPWCRACGKVKLRGEWQRADKETIEQHVLRKCKGEFDKGEYDENTEEAKFIFKNGTVTLTRKIPLEKDDMFCTNCGRQRGGYYEAILQLRGSPNKVKRHAKWAQQWLKQRSFVSKIDEHKHGIDVYVGRFRAAMEFVQMLGMRYKLTKKLAGEKSGKRIYRSTFALRFE